MGRPFLSGELDRTALGTYADSTLSELRMSFLLLRMKSRNAVAATSFRSGDMQ
jgi:hypothetical protein